MTVLTPEFLQTKKYKAMRDRLVLQHGAAIQPGVWDPNDFKVVQRGAGANKSVDVGAGFALVLGNDPGNAGFYHVQNDATVNVAVADAHATLPRIDQVILTVTDTTDGGDVSDAGALSVLTGTATSGATLDNRTGAVSSLPSSSIRLADILVPGGSSSVVTANIRDRRPWARGANARQTNTSFVTLTSSFAAVSGFEERVELSGLPVLVQLNVHFENNTVGGSIQTGLNLNGSLTGTVRTWRAFSGGQDVSESYQFYIDAPTAGSTLVTPVFKALSGTGTFRGDNETAQLMIIENVRPVTDNG